MNDAGLPAPIIGRWKPGQSGNPEGGRIAKRYREALAIAAAKLAADGDPMTTKVEIAAAHIARAKAGDMAAIKEFADRVDGKVPQAIGGADELGPVTHTFRWLEEDEQGAITVDTNE